MLLPYHVYVPTDQRPYVNVSLILLISVVSIWAMEGSSDWPWETLGGIAFSPITGTVSPGLAKDHLPLPILAVTSGLLHIGWLHLLGNMLFLWVFGNAVEYKFRHLGYLGLYLTCGLVGGMAHYLMEGGPAVGASDAINGIMGAFIVFFPRNDVKVAFLWLPVIRTFEVSAIWIVLFYVAWDVVFLVGDTSTTTAVWAHVGGFLAGFLIAIACAFMWWLRPEEDEQTLLQMVGIQGRNPVRFVQR